MNYNRRAAIMARLVRVLLIGYVIFASAITYKVAIAWDLSAALAMGGLFLMAFALALIGVYRDYDIRR